MTGKKVCMDDEDSQAHMQILYMPVSSGMSGFRINTAIIYFSGKQTRFIFVLFTYLNECNDDVNNMRTQKH